MEGSKTALVDPNGAREGMFRHSIDELALADDDACLRTTQQLVPGEERKRCPVSDALLRHWLMGQPEPFRIEQATAAKIMQYRDAQTGA